MALNRDKLNAVILEIASHESVESLGLTKLYKLVYFADAHHLRETGATITGSEYIKYDHGPVPSRGEKAVKQLRRAEKIETPTVSYGPYEGYAISAREKSPAGVLSESELASLNFVCEALGRTSAMDLSDLSHREPAWVNTGRLEKLDPELMHYGASEDPDGL